MRIGIDARFYGGVGKGLGRYVQKLIENLEKIDQENQYFIFLLKENFDDYIPKNKNFKKVLANYRWYTFSEQINMPRILNKHNLDLVHFPHFNVPIFYRKKFIITIHDLILLHFPTLKNTQLRAIFYWIKFLAYKFVIGSAVRRSQKIITVSQFSKKDILSVYPFLNEDKVKVTYEACDFAHKNEALKSEAEIRKYGIIKPYLLYVGNVYPHKNLDKFLDAWKIFIEKNEKEKYLPVSPFLVLVGKRDYFYNRLLDKIKREGIKNVKAVGYLSDEALGCFYKEATAYVFPSLYEGFGLPPLEAMQQGLPVASNDHGCMREILGESAYYFDAKNIESITKMIKRMFTDSNLREELKDRGSQQVLKYDWLKMAQETKSVYEDINVLV